MTISYRFSIVTMSLSAVASVLNAKLLFASIVITHVRQTLAFRHRRGETGVG